MAIPMNWELPAKGQDAHDEHMERIQTGFFAQHAAGHAQDPVAQDDGSIFLQYTPCNIAHKRPLFLCILDTEFFVPYYIPLYKFLL